MISEENFPTISTMQTGDLPDGKKLESQAFGGSGFSSWFSYQKKMVVSETKAYKTSSLDTKKNLKNKT